MKFIRSCPACASELRFPLDKGQIKVICPACGGSFIVDPDNPATYKEGRFEINHTFTPREKKQGLVETLVDLLYLPVYLLCQGTDNFNIRKITAIFMFLLLFAYILRGCHKTENIPPSLPREIQL